MVGIARQNHEFRAAWWVRVSATLSLMLWSSVGLWALCFHTLTPGSFATVVAFILGFAFLTRYYWGMAYLVDDSGVTIRRGGRATHVPWALIESVAPSDVPLAGYELRTGRGTFVLDLFVGRKGRLVDVISARAGLFPV